MKIDVHGKQLAVGDALKTHVNERLNDLNTKFFGRAVDGTVTFAREGHGFYRTQIAIHIGQNIMVQSHATENDPYLSFDVASGKIAQQMRRYKHRLRDHREAMEKADRLQALQARDVVFAAPTPEQDNDAGAESEKGEPAVIAEMTTPIETLTVSEAVMRMDISGQSALMFKNAGNGQFNMVYRRADGNIGWVDPEK